MRIATLGGAGLGLLALLLSACSSDTGGEVNIGGAGNVGGSSNAGGKSSFGGSVSNAGGGITVMPGSGGGGTTAPPPPTDVTVIITADNAYGFGYGSGSQLLNYFGGVENAESADIFSCPVGRGPERYTVPAGDANAGNFVYIIGYADQATTQGVIAKFSREGGQPVYTGSGEWQVCATGQDFDPGSKGPPLALVNEKIAACNAGNLDPATTSGGWVGRTPTAAGNVVFGEDNSTDRNRPSVGNEFLIACDIDPAARWMWYEWLANRPAGTSPFMWPELATGNPTKDFLLFRLAAEAIPEGPPE